MGRLFLPTHKYIKDFVCVIIKCQHITIITVLYIVTIFHTNLCQNYLNTAILNLLSSWASIKTKLSLSSVESEVQNVNLLKYSLDQTAETAIPQKANCIAQEVNIAIFIFQ